MVKCSMGLAMIIGTLLSNRGATAHLQATEQIYQCLETHCPGNPPPNMPCAQLVFLFGQDDRMNTCVEKCGAGGEINGRLQKCGAVGNDGSRTGDGGDDAEAIPRQTNTAELLKVKCTNTCKHADDQECDDGGQVSYFI